LIRPPPRSTRFPCTTLFRSVLIRAGWIALQKLLVIGVEVVAEEREAETATALEAAVAASAVAAEAAEQRTDVPLEAGLLAHLVTDRKSTRLNSSHVKISYAV